MALSVEFPRFFHGGRGNRWVVVLVVVVTTSVLVVVSVKTRGEVVVSDTEGRKVKEGLAIGNRLTMKVRGEGDIEFQRTHILYDLAG